MAIGTPFTAGGATTSGTVVSTLAVPVSTPVPAGNVIVVGAATAGAQTVTGIADTKSNVYVLVDQESSGTGVNTAIYVALNAVALTTSDIVTVTYSASATAAKNAIIVSCSGIMAAAAVDTAASVTGVNAGSPSPSATTGTLAQASELLVAFESNGSGGGAITWSGSWTSRGSQETAGQAFTGAASQVVSSTSPVTASGTITSSKWSVAVVGLKAATISQGTISAAAVGTLSAKATLRATASVAGSGSVAAVGSSHAPSGGSAADGGGSTGRRAPLRSPGRSHRRRYRHALPGASWR